jgi:epoxyqueuosine reductase
MRVLMHSCCGPCLSGAYPALREVHRGDELIPFWENPNIHPYLEYRSRLLSFQATVRHFALEACYGETTYGLRRFLEALAGLPSSERCMVCYRLRLQPTARAARDHGCEAFTTTLLISPYQNRDAIVAIGTEIGREAGLTFLDPDLRPQFRQTHTFARDHDLYRQSYCGCIFSEEERYAGSPKHSLPIP